MFSEAGGSTLTRHKNVKGKQAFTGVRAPGGLPSFPEPVSRASGTVVIRFPESPFTQILNFSIFDIFVQP